MPGNVRAPELIPNLGWLNTDRPLRLSAELRGQVVVLDFWTYCCINCMHILPDLAYLEEKYEDDPVAFVGVHSAKFPNEAVRENIRAAMLRYEIQHPVVIDDGMRIWRAYSVRSWPTVVVVDPNGNVLAAFAGEGNRENLDVAVEQALDQGRSTKTLAERPLELRKEHSGSAASGLRFPGKVLADATSKRLYVADSNHNRIVIAEWPDATGRSKVLHVVGRGNVGREDGPAPRATFHHPQGLAAAHGKLYVADTENHLIRAIDLNTLFVQTVVGTGEMTNDRAGGGMGSQQGINSPWDLTIEGSTLYTAMAGTHQIWRIDLPVGFARALAGTGRENIVDGPTETAALAQPSGICILHGNIYFADSEVSAIRGINMADERVFTIIGEGLFSFGDVDGVYPQAKLQHPLGVAAWKNVLLVADTYNHKIKRVDPASRSATTMFGTGKPGASTTDGNIAFFDPGGLSVAGDELFVADTNNHRIVRIQLVTGAWHEIAFEGLQNATLGASRAALPAGARSEGDRATEEDSVPAVVCEPVSLRAECDIELTVNARLPEGSHLNPEAPWSIRVRAGDRTLHQQTGMSDSLPLSLRIPASSAIVDDPWDIFASFTYCTDSNGGLCVPAELRWAVPVDLKGRSPSIRLAGDVTKTNDK